VTTGKDALVIFGGHQERRCEANNHSSDLEKQPCTLVANVRAK
jgi:hypothetical protein